MEISKELLSEVLEEDVRLGEYITIDNDGVPQKYNMKITLNGTTLNYWRYYKEWDDGSTMCKSNINIYELAFKLKEWLYSKDVMFDIRWHTNSSPRHIVVMTYGKRSNFYIGDSKKDEVEALIKLGESTLKELNEKQLQH